MIDNETAVNNLSRLANKTGCTFVSEKLGDKKYQVKMAVQTEQTGGTFGRRGICLRSTAQKSDGSGNLPQMLWEMVMMNWERFLIKGFTYALLRWKTHPIQLFL